MADDAYKTMAEWIEMAAERARQDGEKGEKSKEQIKDEFFQVAIACFNEFIAGDITLADGRVINTPEIEPPEIEI